MDPSTIPTSQPSLPSNISQPSSYTNQPQPSTTTTTVTSEKRQRKPLTIVNPTTHEAVQISTTTAASSSTTTMTTTTTATANASTTSAPIDIRPPETTTDSTTIDSKSVDDLNKIQKQTDFRHQFAKAMSDNSTTSTKKSNDDPPGAAPTKQSLPVQSTSSASSSRSGSMSRPKSPVNDSKSSDQPAQVYPGIRTGTLPDEKINSKPTSDEKRERSDSQKQTEIEPIDDSKSTVRKARYSRFFHVNHDSYLQRERGKKEPGYACFFLSFVLSPHYFNA